jgi:hypothetical protein
VPHSSVNYENVQLSSESDPITHSADWDEKSKKGTKDHPMNYFVPDFGRDHEVSTTFNSLKKAENITGHEWFYKAKSDEEKAA